jgi:hypothetical protein
MHRDTTFLISPPSFHICADGFLRVNNSRPLSVLAINPTPSVDAAIVLIDFNKNAPCSTDTVLVLVRSPFKKTNRPLDLSYLYFCRIQRHLLAPAEMLCKFRPKNRNEFLKIPK